MFECLKDGYTFFARYDSGTLVATLTLKDDDIYKEVIKLNEDEIVFLYTFGNIESSLDDDTALSVIYDREQNRFISSIQDKITTGEYNDKVVWNTKTSSMGSNFIDSLNNLDDKLLNEKGRRSFK